MKLSIAMLSALMMAFPALPAAEPEMTVYKTRTCGCCGKWAEHMKAAGFKVDVQDVPATAGFQQKYNVPARMRSCHTARVGGYTIEGHVPAADVKRLLKAKPKTDGIAVPGMPMGSPGMEGSYRDAYEVLTFEGAVFQKYPGDLR